MSEALYAALVDGELVAEGDVLEGEVWASGDGAGESSGRASEVVLGCLKALDTGPRNSRSEFPGGTRLFLHLNKGQSMKGLISVICLATAGLAGCRSPATGLDEEYEISEAVAAADTVALVSWDDRTVYVVGEFREEVGKRWGVQNPSANEWSLRNQSGAQVVVTVSQVALGEAMVPGRV